MSSDQHPHLRPAIRSYSSNYAGDLKRTSYTKSLVANESGARPIHSTLMGNESIPEKPKGRKEAIDDKRSDSSQKALNQLHHAHSKVPQPLYRTAQSSRLSVKGAVLRSIEDEDDTSIKIEPDDDQTDISPFVGPAQRRARSTSSALSQFSYSTVNTPLAPLSYGSNIISNARTSRDGQSLASIKDESSRSPTPPPSPTPQVQRPARTTAKPVIKVFREPPALSPRQHKIIARHTRTAYQWRESYIDDILKEFNEIEDTSMPTAITISSMPDQHAPKNKRPIDDMIKIHWYAWWLRSDQEVAAKLKSWNLELPGYITESERKRAKREAKERLIMAKKRWKGGDEESNDWFGEAAIKEESKDD